MQWLWPWQAALAGGTLAGLLGLVAWRARRRQEALARWLGGALPGLPAPARGRRRVRTGLLLGALGLIVVALARPRGPAAFTAGQVRGTVLVLLDVSASMRATDVLPSRREAARQWVEAALSQFPAARLGLIAVAGEAQVLCPPTADHALLLDLVRSLPADLALREGSEFGPALTLARSLLDREGGGGVILVTDGEHHDPQPAAALAADRTIDLVVVTVGGATPVPVPAAAGPGTVADPRDGRPALTSARPAAMAALARAAGGCAVAAGQPGAGLAEAVRAIGRRAAERSVPGLVPVRAEWAPWVLALALALLVARLLVADRPAAGAAAVALPAGLLGAVVLGAGLIGLGGAGDPSLDTSGIGALRQASLQAPGHDRHRCLYNLALALQQGGAEEEARRTYVEALGLPGCPPAVRARCLNNLGAMGLVRAHAVAERDPGGAVAAAAQARAALVEAVRLDPSLAEAALNLGAAATLAASVQTQYDQAQALARTPGAAPRTDTVPSGADAGRDAAPAVTTGAAGLAPEGGSARSQPAVAAVGRATAADVLQRLAAGAGSSHEFLERVQARRGAALPALRLPW